MHLLADCFNQTNSNQGCIVKETQPDSFGAGFNNNGGGAFALLFNTDGIKFWFFPVSSLPPTPSRFLLSHAFQPL